jgi:type III secretory pathway component EscU
MSRQQASQNIALIIFLTFMTKMVGLQFSGLFESPGPSGNQPMSYKMAAKCANHFNITHHLVFVFV